MAIKTSDYQTTKHHGLKQSKTKKNEFLLDFRVSGQRTRKKINSESLDDAYTTLLKYKVEKEKEYSLDVNVESTIDDYFKIIQGIKAKTWCDKAKYDYENHYKNHVKKFFGHLIVKDIRPHAFTKYNQKNASMSNRQQKKSYEILIAIFKQAKIDDLISETPINSSQVPVRDSQKEKTYITDPVEKYYYIREAIYETFKDRPELVAFFLFGLYCRRLNEVRTLKWKDINFMKDEYIVRDKNSKVDEDMVFDLPEEIREILSPMSTGRSQEDYVFSIKHVIRYYPKIRELGAVPEFTFHRMRNLTVSALFEKGATFEDLSTMLGHNDIATIKKYLTMNRTAATKRTNKMTLLLHENPMDD